jgi:AMIN domain-containing protein
MNICKGHRARALAICSVLGSLVGVSMAANGPATIRRVSLGTTGIEVEIQSSQPVKPQVQLITGPDRLVVDFPNSIPSNDLRGVTANRGDLKSVRVGLFAKNPPVTRVVLDLKGPQTYQLIPSGNTLVVKLGSSAASPAAMTPGKNKTVVEVVSMPQPATPPSPPAPPEPKVEVRYESGRMSIWANRATLAEVLDEIHRKTGADVPIPPGAQQELVVTSIGPAPVREALASLLNGSQFNFIVVGYDGDPGRLKSLILTPHGQSTPQPMITYTQPAVAQSAPPPDPEPDQEGPSNPQPDNQPGQQQQTKDDAPPQ